MSHKHSLRPSTSFSKSSFEVFTSEERESMSEECSTLIVHRTGGWIRRKGKSPLGVLVDGKLAGTIGEEIVVTVGPHDIEVRTFLFTCRPHRIEVVPASRNIFQYRTSWLALGFIMLGLVLFLALAYPVAFILDRLQALIAGDVLPPIFGLVLLLIVFGLYGTLAFVVPPLVLTKFGIFSHKLICVDFNESV